MRPGDPTGCARDADSDDREVVDSGQMYAHLDLDEMRRNRQPRALLLRLSLRALWLWWRCAESPGFQETIGPAEGPFEGEVGSGCGRRGGGNDDEGERERFGNVVGTILGKALENGVEEERRQLE